MRVIHCFLHSYESTTSTGQATVQPDRMAANGQGRRQESWLSNATATTGYTEEDDEEAPRPGILSKQFWTTPRAAHALIVALLGSLAGGLALPNEIPIIRSFACDWVFRHDQAVQTWTEDRCQDPTIAKLAGEVITSARILNALISE